MLLTCSDEEDEVWGRRQALPRSYRSSTNPEDPEERESRRSDPWSVRMRSKYGLDVDGFSYDPSRSRQSQQAPVLPAPATISKASRRCTIM